jgi:hypothetical protein
MSIREAIRRFRELHEEFKGGAFKSKEARAFYDGERDEFLRALLSGQQLALKPGQSPRQVLRVAVSVSLGITFGPRQESATTIDIGSAGFAALLGIPLAARIPVDFELGTTPSPTKGRARVVASVKDGAGKYRTSFQIETISEDDRGRLELFVTDTALAAYPDRR